MLRSCLNSSAVFALVFKNADQELYHTQEQDQNLPEQKYLLMQKQDRTIQKQDQDRVIDESSQGKYSALLREAVIKQFFSSRQLLTIEIIIGNPAFSKTILYTIHSEKRIEVLVDKIYILMNYDDESINPLMIQSILVCV